MVWLFGSPGWVDYQWYLVGRSNLSNHSFCRNFHGMGAQVVQADGYPWGPRMQLSIGFCWYYCCRQLGTWCQFLEHMDPRAVSFDTGICMHTYCAKWRYGDLWCGADGASDIIKAKFPHLHRVTTLWGTTYSSFVPIWPELVWVSGSDPDMTAPKWACLHIMVAFASSPLVIKLRALSIILEPTMTWTISE